MKKNGSKRGSLKPASSHKTAGSQVMATEMDPDMFKDLEDLYDQVAEVKGESKKTEEDSGPAKTVKGKKGRGRPVEPVPEKEPEKIDEPTVQKSVAKKKKKEDKEEVRPSLVTSNSKSRSVVAVPQSTDNEAVVLDYMRKRNRPYSLINIFDNLQGKIKKPELQQVLDTLSSKGHLVAKDFGKNVVYWYNQKLIEVNNDILEQSKYELKQRKEEKETLEMEIKDMRVTLGALERTPTTTELSTGIETMTSELSLMKKKLEGYKGNNCQTVSKEEIESLEGQLSGLAKIKSTRQKILKEMIDTLTESSGMSKKALLESIGID